MLKFLLILFLIGFVFFRTIGFFLRLLSGSSVQNKARQNPYTRQGQTQQKPSNGNVNIDYVPNNKGQKSGEKFTGGEYVDFEEVE